MMIAMTLLTKVFLLTSYLGHNVALPSKVLVAEAQEVVNHKTLIAVPVQFEINASPLPQSRT